MDQGPGSAVNKDSKNIHNPYYHDYLVIFNQYLAISQTIQYRAIVTVEHQYELVCDLSSGCYI